MSRCGTTSLRLMQVQRKLLTPSCKVTTALNIRTASPREMRRRSIHHVNTSNQCQMKHFFFHFKLMKMQLRGSHIQKNGASFMKIGFSGIQWMACFPPAADSPVYHKQKQR